MSLLDRYLLRVFIKNFLLALMGMTALFVFQKLIGQLMDADHPGSQLAIFTAMEAPAIAIQLLPSAILLGTVLTLGGLNRTNELVAYYSVGMGTYRIFGTLLSLVFMISCLALSIQDRILPILHKKQTVYYWRVMRNRADFHLDFKKDKIWYRTKNLIYNLRSFDRKTQRISGMAIYELDPAFKLTRMIEAKEATYSPDKGWTLHTGSVTTFSESQEFPHTQAFEQRALPIPEKPSDFQEIEKEVKGLRLKELYQYIERVQATGTDTQIYEVDWHSRISQSFIPLIMCLLGFRFSSANRRQSNLPKDIGICLGFTFFYWLFHSIGLSLGTNSALPPIVAAWLPSALFAAIAIIQMTRHKNG